MRTKGINRNLLARMDLNYLVVFRLNSVSIINKRFALWCKIGSQLWVRCIALAWQPCKGDQFIIVSCSSSKGTASAQVQPVRERGGSSY
jgi:hypothetical protein